MGIEILLFSIIVLAGTTYHIGKGTPVKGLKASAIILSLVILKILWFL